MSQPKSTYKDLAISDIQPAADHRQDEGNDLESSRLYLSIKELGMLDPIAVCEDGHREYTIIDGHRRYQVADRLRHKTIRCHVYPRMDRGNRERLRFELQTNIRELSPLERSRVIARIKEEKQFTSNNDLAAFLYLPASNVSLSLQLLKQEMIYADLARRYHISETYLAEFLRLRPKLRTVREFDINRVTQVLFEKAQHRVIKNAKHFRNLVPIFLRAVLHEEELYRFLSDPDMTVSELEQRTRYVGDTTLYMQTLTSVAAKQRDGIAFTAQEERVLQQLHTILRHIFAHAHAVPRQTS